MQKIKKILFIFFGVSILFILSLLGYIWITSPGTPAMILDKDGHKLANSISEIVKIPVGGIDQYLIIRGQNADKPVLLLLHGGPGSPELSLLIGNNEELENLMMLIFQ